MGLKFPSLLCQLYLMVPLLPETSFFSSVKWEDDACLGLPSLHVGVLWKLYSTLKM